MPSDDAVRKALASALDRVGVTDPPLVRVRPGDGRTATSPAIVREAGRQARNPNPVPTDRAFADEVGKRVMCWSWIENRRGGGEVGDKEEERIRQGGTFLSWHLNGVLVNAKTRGDN